MPASAQSTDAADDAPVQLGPLAASPSVRLTNVGHDSNVYNDSEGPTSDVTATVSPSVNAWLRLPVVRVSGRSQFDFIYFHQLTDLRAVDTDNAARVEIPLRWLTPFVAGGRSVTRHRRNLEIDAPVRRLDETRTVGVDLHLTGKMTVGFDARRALTRYSGDTLYGDSDLAQLLNRTGNAESVRLRYALTPFTSVGLTAERQSDRFDSASERDSNSVWILPEVEFQPLALVTGRAQIGFRRRSFLDAQMPEFRGTVARVDLGYTLLGRTRFAVGFQRDLAYSFRLDLEEYLLSGARASVTQRLTDPWEVGASVGRFRLDYRLLGSGDRVGVDAASLAETFLSVGAEAGYRMGRTRLGVQVDYNERQTQAIYRQYERLRITSTLSHDF